MYNDWDSFYLAHETSPFAVLTNVRCSKKKSPGRREMMHLILQMQHQWFVWIINLEINFTRCSFKVCGSFLPPPAVSPHPETHPRPMMVEPRRPGPKLHPASPDWAGTGTRKPDLNPRVAIFNPRAFELIISHCICWGRWCSCVHLDCDTRAHNVWGH